MRLFGVFSTFFLSALMVLSTAPVANTREAEALVIERAEIIAGRDGQTDRAYVTIWNGGESPVSIIDVSIAGYEDVRVVTAAETTRVKVTDAVLTIPAKSELLMRPSTVYFEMRRTNPLTVNASVEIKIEFDNKRNMIIATSPKTQGTFTDHHHRREG
ncbi:hypothetical protein ACFHWW_26810 [Ensifer sp. P24N7]|uniref:hypothetical protein n=1 Tax=Sinorhizobium sp. P24N7 TaxID=3348358 RepID=UPI0035F44548